MEINADGETLDEVDEAEGPPKEDGNPDEGELEYQRRAHSCHVSRKAINTYGTTDGCPACNVINRRGHLLGKLGYNHNMTCRTRILEAMRADPEYRRLMDQHELSQQAGDIEMLTVEQVVEKKKQFIESNTMCGGT